MFKINKILLLTIVIILSVALSGCYQTQSQQDESLRERWELWYEFDVLFLEIAEPTVDMTLEEIVFNYIATNEVQEKVSRLQAIAYKMKTIDYELYRSNMFRRLGHLNNFLVFYQRFESDGNFENVYWLDGLNLEISRPDAHGLEGIRRNVETIGEFLAR